MTARVATPERTSTAGRQVRELAIDRRTATSETAGTKAKYKDGRTG
jgi:hypothetical protein